MQDPGKNTVFITMAGAIIFLVVKFYMTGNVQGMDFLPY